MRWVSYIKHFGSIYRKLFIRDAVNTSTIATFFVPAITHHSGFEKRFMLLAMGSWIVHNISRYHYLFYREEPRDRAAIAFWLHGFLMLSTIPLLICTVGFGWTALGYFSLLLPLNSILFCLSRIFSENLYPFIASLIYFLEVYYIL